ncbi:hypothetical protein SAMN04488034_10728 [Salinimicrobium catena]|uniref:Uncharacterized protein n=1 Tax=Salinimicrobium catena TaxID=390640 RepID=A0A1H5P187_9FLAO|nr:hypothetical protein SAMN04488140_10758 [Salinimicrobium catena]SEF06787.1 hypothetical protein SAMN04488034_10728 [Salinimicrobium catena]
MTMFPLDVLRLKAFVGAGFYAYLYVIFLRRLGKQKSVLVKGRAHHFLDICRNRNLDKEKKSNFLIFEKF